MFVHTFGAYFGLMVSFVLTRDFSSSGEGPTYTSDIFAMIGTNNFKITKFKVFYLLLYQYFFHYRNNLFVALLAFVQRRIS